jgi:hypothetical protein
MIDSKLSSPAAAGVLLLLPVAGTTCVAELRSIPLNGLLGVLTADRGANARSFVRVADANDGLPHSVRDPAPRIEQ